MRGGRFVTPLPHGFDRGRGQGAVTSQNFYAAYSAVKFHYSLERNFAASLGLGTDWVDQLLRASGD